MKIYQETDLAHLWKLPHGIYRIVKPSLTLEFRQYSCLKGPNAKFFPYEKIMEVESIEEADDFIKDGATR